MEAEAVGGREGQVLRLELGKPPHLHDRMCPLPNSCPFIPTIYVAAFRALVQENVKANVLRIAGSTTILNVRSAILDLRARSVNF